MSKYDFNDICDLVLLVDFKYEQFIDNHYKFIHSTYPISAIIPKHSLGISEGVCADFIELAVLIAKVKNITLNVDEMHIGGDLKSKLTKHLNKCAGNEEFYVPAILREVYKIGNVKDAITHIKNITKSSN